MPQPKKPSNPMDRRPDDDENLDPAWRVERGVDLADGRRFEPGVTIYKLEPTEAEILESKGAIVRIRGG